MHDLAGLPLGLTAALAWGWTDTVATVASRRSGSLRATAGAQLTSVVVLATLMLVTGTALPDDPAVVVLSLACGMVSSVAYLAFFTALLHGPISVVSPVVSTYGGLTVVLSVLVLGEALAPGQVLGVAVATAGVVLASVVFTGGLPNPAGRAGRCLRDRGPRGVRGAHGGHVGPGPRRRLAAVLRHPQLPHRGAVRIERRVHPPSFSSPEGPSGFRCPRASSWESTRKLFFKRGGCGCSRVTAFFSTRTASPKPLTRNRPPMERQPCCAWRIRNAVRLRRNWFGRSWRMRRHLPQPAHSTTI